MSAQSYRSSKPDHWTSPRPVTDPILRRMHHGRIQPMEQGGGFFSRLLGRA